ncbi:MAG: NAD(P)-dependent dehydrogenase (short-subunit alcohol dehydrogenase family) [Litorivivens sp.]|jgi:NAD(P)-dependent dehydrogenase (short-subunit alcohol dehydrogenase family)
MNIVIIGASGGIGQALTQAIATQYPESNLFGTYLLTKPRFDGATFSQLDASIDSAVSAYAKNFERVDWLINCAGFLHNEEKGPEKSVRHFETEFFLENITRNTLPSMLLARHFQRPLRNGHQSVFAAISAKVGSISDNQLGGWFSYRSSKAALNMFLKGLALEWQRAVPNCNVAALHPGTTDTTLSKPFQKNVPKEKLFSPEQSANYLLHVIEQLSAENSGQFWSWDGSRIPW